MPGSDIGGQLRVVVSNQGDRVAPGTGSSGQRGYMVDIILTRGAMPTGFAQFSEKYFDGVLLKGGRISNTRDIGPGARIAYRTAGEIPFDTPPGSYRLCARADPGSAVRERNEANNDACIPLTISPRVIAWQRLQPFYYLGQEPQVRILPSEKIRVLPSPVAPARPAGGGDAKRSVLSDGTLEIRFADGSIQRLLPNGQLVHIAPDGKVMIPLAMQVQPAELPVLPDGLVSWGDGLAERLLAILRNILTADEFEAYRQTEKDKTYYEVIDWRLRSITFLTVP